MKRRVAFALMGALLVLPAGVVAVGQPPQGAKIDLSDDLARLGGTPLTKDDLLADLKGEARSGGGDAVPLDAASLLDEFDASAGKIRSQQAQIDAEEEARLQREAEAARLAQIRAAEAQSAQQAAAHLQGLRNSCDRNFDRCENRCSGASDSALLGAFADALSGKPSNTQMPSYSACASQCRSERSQCFNAAEGGQSHRPSFTGPTANSTYGGGYGGAQSFAPDGGTSSPQCKAAEAEATRAMTGLGRTTSICQSARDSITMYQAGLRYLQACPSVDPTGRQRRQYEDAIRQSRDVERKSCN